MSPKNSVNAALQRLEQRHRELLNELATMGLVLRGTIRLRQTRCGNPTCRCKADPPRLHGPYYLWTRKVAGKTVTATLPAEHAALLQDWNRNMHTLDTVVREMQDIGLKAAALLRNRP